MRLKPKAMWYMSTLSNRWKFRVGVIIIFTAIAVSVQAFNTETVENKYPSLATGVLRSAKLVEMGPGTLVSVDDFEIPQSWIKETLGGFPSERHKEIEGSLFFLLEQAVTQRFILHDANIAGIPSDGRTKDQIIQSYLTERIYRITVSDEKAKSFYDDNKELVGGLPFDQVKESIRAFLIQKKRQDAVSDYMMTLGDSKVIRINKSWVKKQYVMAMENPVDRARRSGKPTMVEFGAVGCVPCDMMQPILDKLRKNHPEHLNVVFVNVRENQIIGSRFGVRSIPVQVFYDRTGKEVFRHVGFFSETEVNKQISKMGIR